MKTISVTKRENSVQIPATTSSTAKISLAGIKPSDPKKIVLKKPPSINHLYAYTCSGGFARSYITKEGTVWFEDSSWQVKAQWKKKTPITIPCEIWIDLYTNRASTQDGDNIVKPILDLLQKNNVIKNDALFYDIHVHKEQAPKTEERVELQLMGY